MKIRKVVILKGMKKKYSVCGIMMEFDIKWIRNNTIRKNIFAMEINYTINLILTQGN